MKLYTYIYIYKKPNIQTIKYRINICYSSDNGNNTFRLQITKGETCLKLFITCGTRYDVGTRRGLRDPLKKCTSSNPLHGRI